MKKVEDYEWIRKAYHIEELGIRKISRRFGHGRKLEIIIRTTIMLK